MAWIAAAVAGGTIVGGLINSNASSSAADKQSESAQRGIDAQLQMFNQNKADLAPWMQTGRLGNEQLMKLLGLGGNSFDPNAQLVRPFSMQDFQADPGYQYRLNQGLDSVLARKSALGGVNSGATLKALDDYGQAMAGQEYTNAFNRYRANQGDIYSRLSGVSNSGENAASGVAGLGGNAANQISGLNTQQGNAQAAGIVGSSNALTGAGQSIMNQWLQANALQQGQNRADVFNDQMNYINSQAFQ